MEARFTVGNRYEIGGLGVVMGGKLIHGQIDEGVVGRTSKGKRFTVVKLEVENDRVQSAQAPQNMMITVKHITQSDVWPGEVIYFD